MNGRKTRAANDLVAKELGEAIRNRRHAAGLTQANCARAADMHRNDLSMIERGRRCPRIDWVVNLAAVLDLEPAHLLAGVDWTPRTREHRGHFGVTG